MTALEVQWEYLDMAKKYGEAHGLECIGAEEVGNEILRRWEATLTTLEEDPSQLSTTVDWIAKQRLFEAFMDRHEVGWDDPRLAAMDLQYHDLRPEKCLARRVGLERIVDDADVEQAKTDPPERTRAYFRGRCLEKFGDEIVAANWDSLVFDIGEDPLRRVPMMEPLRGTAQHVGSLLDECENAADLLHRLGT